jgi:dTMP kinase
MERLETMNEYEGVLVAAEGIDGAGTSTLVNRLRNHYSDNDDVIFTKEPSGGFYGQCIRERIEREDEPSPADFYAFLADRYEHCENVIRPALEEGKTVITDRYALSTYAYQSKVLDEQLGIIDPISYIEEMTYHFTIEPDAYFYINIGVDTALGRIETDDKYEKKEHLKEAKRMYDYVVQDKRNVIEFPGNWSEDKIFEETWLNISGMRDD